MGDWVFGLPRATYEKRPADDGRLDPLYGPASRLRTEQICLHGDCRWDQLPVT